MSTTIIGKGGGGKVKAYAVAFGKHPGWDDHIDEIGLDTDLLVRLKRVLYTEGLAGNIDSGAWDKLEEVKRLPVYDHAFYWRTPEGWLILYHGVRHTPGGCLYRLGLALLDLEKPWEVLRRSDDWVFAPLMPYERHGDVNGVVFPCGYLFDDRFFWVSYGRQDHEIWICKIEREGLMKNLFPACR